MSQTAYSSLVIAEKRCQRTIFRGAGVVPSLDEIIDIGRAGLTVSEQIEKRSGLVPDFRHESVSLVGPV